MIHASMSGKQYNISQHNEAGKSKESENTRLKLQETLENPKLRNLGNQRVNAFNITYIILKEEEKGWIRKRKNEDAGVADAGVTSRGCTTQGLRPAFNSYHSKNADVSTCFASRYHKNAKLALRKYLDAGGKICVKQLQNKRKRETGLSLIHIWRCRRRG